MAKAVKKTPAASATSTYGIRTTPSQRLSLALLTAKRLCWGWGLLALRSLSNAACQRPLPAASYAAAGLRIQRTTYYCRDLAPPTKLPSVSRPPSRYHTELTSQSPPPTPSHYSVTWGVLWRHDRNLTEGLPRSGTTPPHTIPVLLPLPL